MDGKSKASMGKLVSACLKIKMKTDSNTGEWLKKKKDKKKKTCLAYTGVGGREDDLCSIPSTEKK